MLIVCYVPEIARYNAGSMVKISDRVENSFKETAKSHDRELDIITITRVDRRAVLRELNNLAKYIEQPNHKAIVYYFGHGDQVRDRDGDEKDGKDEIWRTQNILDDEITKIFSNIHKNSRLYLFSDSCSSGSMIDDNNKRPWVTISSANDRQDAMSTIDGGVFTLFGLLPAISQHTYLTPHQIHKYIKHNVQIGSQTSLLRCGMDGIQYENMFD